MRASDTLTLPLCSTHEYSQTPKQDPVCSFLSTWNYFFSWKKNGFFWAPKKYVFFFKTPIEMTRTLFLATIFGSSFFYWLNNALIKRLSVYIWCSHVFWASGTTFCKIMWFHQNIIKISFSKSSNCHNFFRVAASKTFLSVREYFLAMLLSVCLLAEFLR